MTRFSSLRLRSPSLALLAAVVIASLAAASSTSAQIQLPSFPALGDTPAQLPISAYLSVPRPDGTAEEGRPFLHPHFYTAGANALEFELSIRRDYDYSSRYSTAALQHRGGNCPWWDDDGTCGAVTFADDWSHVRVTAYAPDADGDFNVAFGASHGIQPKTGSFCETSATLAIPGSVCVIGKADWKTAQGATADADAVAPLKLTIETGASESRNLQIDAVVWSARSVAIADSGHQIHAQPDRGINPELFFYKVERHRYSPCSAAEMAAEAGDECDPVVDDGQIIDIGLTITNGPSGSDGIDHAVTGHVPRRDHQRRFLDFDRVVFEWDSPGTVLGIRPVSNCHPHGTLRSGGECTLTSDDWFASYPIGSWGVAWAHDDSVGHIGIPFAVLPSDAPADHEITAKLYRQPPGQTPPETPAIATITIEAATAPSRPTVYAITDEIGNEVDLLLGSRRHFDWLVYGYDIETSLAGPMLFDELAASGPALTVSVDRGHFTMWHEECVPAGGSCSLSFTREEMKSGYNEDKAAGAPSIPAGAAGDEWRVPLRAKLQYFAPFNDEGPALIRAVLHDAAGAERGERHLHEFRRTSAPVLEVRTPGDSDGILAPGQTAAVQIGFAFTTSGAPGAAPALGTDLSVECVRGSRFCQLVEDSTLDPDESWFSLGAGATWESSGDARLDASAGDFRCELEQDAAGGGESAYFCAYGTDGAEPGERVYPRLTIGYGASDEVRLTANLRGLEGRRILIDDRFHQRVDRRWHRGEAEYFLSAALPVGTVLEVASAELRRANREAGPIRVRREAALEIGVLNENGAAARLDQISSIVLTATAGALHGPYCGFGPSGTAPADASPTCSIGTVGPLAAWVEADATRIAGIPVTFVAPEEEGSAVIQAAVLASTFDPGGPPEVEPLEIEFTGDAAKLSLTSDIPRVRNVGTPDSGDDRDDLDMIELPVDAFDGIERRTVLPDRVLLEIAGPDGEPVGSRIIAVPDCRAPDGSQDRSRCRFILDVDAPASNPLAPGLYTLTARAGGIAADAQFGVAGDPASVSASLGEPPGLAEIVDAEIVVSDADGQPVADGSEVRIAVQGRVPGRQAGIKLVSPANGVVATKNGRAAASFVVIRREVSVIRLSADGPGPAPPATAVAVFDARAASDAALDAPASRGLQIADGAPVGGFASWRAEASITASALLADLPGASAVWLWNGAHWLRYSATEEERAPGDFDFTINPGDTLWITREAADDETAGNQSADNGSADGEAARDGAGDDGGAAE